MGWEESFLEWCIAVFQAQRKLGPIDPRLKPKDVDNCFLTVEEVMQMEKLADELLTE